MKYASIRSFDISNGEGIGVALFTQGCKFHCKNCFNQETWDLDGGNDWTDEVEETIGQIGQCGNAENGRLRHAASVPRNEHRSDCGRILAGAAQ